MSADCLSDKGTNVSEDGSSSEHSSGSDDVKVKVKSLRCVRLFATPWTLARQAPPCMGFSRQEYWSGFAISFSRGSSQPRDRTQVSCVAGRRFNLWTTREATMWVLNQQTDKKENNPNDWSWYETCKWKPHQAGEDACGVWDATIFFLLFFFSLLVVLGRHKAVPRPCLAVEGGGCSQVVVGGLPSAVASLAQAVNSWTWVWTSRRRWWRTGKPACCSPWGGKESDTTEQLNNNRL